MLVPGVEVHFCYGPYWDRELRDHPLPQLENAVRSAKKLVPQASGLYSAFRQAVFSAGAAWRRIDVYHAPNFLPLKFSGPAVITVHDLSVFRYPETHPADRVRVMTEGLPKAIERARYVLVDSEFVRGEVLAKFAVSPDKVVTTLLGVSGVFRPCSRQEVAPIVEKHGLQAGAYILSVGTLEPRKNLARTLDAYSRLPAATRRAFPLALVGMAGWKMDSVQERLRALLAAGEIRILGYVSQQDLPMLFAGARALVYPSLYEGFGLPVLEAMASGIPVVTSNQGSLLEVAGTAALTVDPEDPDAIGGALLSLLEESKERQSRIARGIDWAHTFTWERCAEQTVAVYRRAAA